MKKIKLFMASFIGAIALVFACCLGGRVNAKGITPITNTYTLDSAAELPAANKNGGSGTGTSTATSGDTLSLTVKNNYSTSNMPAYSSSKYINIKSSTDSQYISLKFTARGAGSIKFVSFTTQKNTKYATFTLYSVGENDTLTSISSERVAPVSEDKTYSFTTAGTYDMRIYGDSTQTSNIYCSSIVITETYTKALYNVNYDANGYGTAPTTVENVGSLSEAMLASLDSDSSYTFKGWYFDSACTDAATTSSNLAAKDTDNDYEVTLYAKWETKSSYLINFNVDSALYDEKEVAFSGDGKLTSWPDNPTKLYYAFDGWYNGETKVDADTVFTADTTLEARFVLDTIAIDSTTTLNFDDSNLTATNNVYDSQNCNKFTIDNTDSYITKESSFKFVTKAGSTSKNHIAFSIPANSIAKISLIGIRTTSSGNSFSIKISDGITSKTASHSFDKADNVYFTTWENDSESAVTIYIYRDGSQNCKINEISVSVIGTEGTTTADNSSLVFRAQYDATTEANATKLRFIGMIQGINYEDYGNITSIQFTFTFNGKNRVCNVTKLYKSIKNNGSNLLVPFDNTMYVVYQLSNINKEAYKGQTLTNCEFTVTFNDESTLSVSHDDITLPNFTTVIA